MDDIAARLQKVLESSPVWAEARFHRRQSNALQVQKGLVKQVNSHLISGVGFRVLYKGAWGFSSTSDTSTEAMEKALKKAVDCAKSLSEVKKAVIDKLPSTPLAQGTFTLDGYETLRRMSLEEKLGHVRKAEEEMRHASTSIQSATCRYNEIFEEKAVVTTDGARALTQLARNEFVLRAFADHQGKQADGFQSLGRTGTWECLFNHNTISELADKTTKLAMDLAKAPVVPGGLTTLILSPAMVGLLSHEAIGHTVEADFVLSGSVAKGKLGQKVGSPLVTLCDSGVVNGAKFGGGDLLVDDEGVPTQQTTIIKDGILTSYLHNRESAALFGVAPTGNARAWLYHDEPLIRMRNTYIAPGTTSLEEMIATTEDGFLVDSPLGGQADATGEFMFGALKVTRIQNGKLGEVYRGATISGQAFNVLNTVDAVSKEFELDLGAGHCGKGQPAKVDAGGPYIRCKAIIGGSQK